LFVPVQFIRGVGVRVHIMNPDGKRLAIQSTRDGPTAVHVVDLQGNMLARRTR
jgi:Tol biopolymer transport system component